jgi:hypothetical protein
LFLYFSAVESAHQGLFGMPPIPQLGQAAPNFASKLSTEGGIPAGSSTTSNPTPNLFGAKTSPFGTTSNTTNTSSTAAPTISNLFAEALQPPATNPFGQSATPTLRLPPKLFLSESVREKPDLFKSITAPKISSAEPKPVSNPFIGQETKPVSNIFGAKEAKPVSNPFVGQEAKPVSIPFGVGGGYQKAASNPFSSDGDKAIFALPSAKLFQRTIFSSSAGGGGGDGKIGSNPFKTEKTEISSAPPVAIKRPAIGSRLQGRLGVRPAKPTVVSLSGPHCHAMPGGSRFSLLLLLLLFLGRY